MTARERYLRRGVRRYQTVTYTLPSTTHGISKHLAKARKKHPAFPRYTIHKFCVLFEEVGEFIKAVVWERKQERIVSEAMDIIAVLVRWVEGD